MGNYEYALSALLYMQGARFWTSHRLFMLVSLDVVGCRIAGVAFSFNGGKDSTVLLHIIRAAIALPLPERTADLQSNDHGKLACQ